MSVRRLSAILDSLLADTLRLPAAAIQVRILRSWEEIAGPLLSGRTAPGRVRNGVLTVFVRNHAWAQELQLSKPALLGKIRSVVGGEKVREIRFLVDAECFPSGLPIPDAPAPGGTRERAGGAVDDPRDRSPLPEPDGLDEVRDPETREILRAIHRKSSRRPR